MTKPPKGRQQAPVRYRRPSGVPAMTVQEAQRFVGVMRPLLRPGPHDLRYLHTYCSQVLGVEVEHFRDLALDDAYAVAKQAKKEFARAP